MKIKQLSQVAALTLAASVSSVAVANESQSANPISMAELASTTCFQCHGAEGQYMEGTIPGLAGYPADVMYQQLIAFKTGERPNTIMQRHAKGYSDAELKAIADYLATLKP